MFEIKNYYYIYSYSDKYFFEFVRYVSLRFSLYVLALWSQRFDRPKFGVTFGAASFDLFVFSLASAIKTVKTLFSPLLSFGTHGTFVFVKFAIVLSFGVFAVSGTMCACCRKKKILLHNNYSDGDDRDPYPWQVFGPSHTHSSSDPILTVCGDGDREENRIGAAHLLVRTSKDRLTYILARLALPADGDDNCPCRYYDYYLIFFPLLLLLECYRYYLLYFGRTCSRHAIHSLIELNIMTLITPWCRSLSIVSLCCLACLPPHFGSSFRFNFIFFRMNPRRRRWLWRRFWTRTCFVYLVRSPVYGSSTFTTRLSM